MAEMKPQSYENHRKYVPTYHFLALGILLVNVLWSIWKLYQAPSVDSALVFALAVALIILGLQVRLFPLTVQDRVIRLEMKLRLHEILPEELRPRIDELRRGHFVALRFASDEELPHLVQEVLDGKLRKGEAIKKQIKSWRADHFRC